MILKATRESGFTFAHKISSVYARVVN